MITKEELIEFEGLWGKERVNDAVLVLKSRSVEVTADSLALRIVINLLRDKRSQMKSYIGTKIVQAEPQMGPPGLESGSPQGPGYKVVYEDGYVSWSPKATFDRCNREITEAEKALIFTED